MSNATAKKLVWRQRFRKGASGFHALMYVLLMAMLWVMVNHLSFRHFRREDWSHQQLTVLAPQTREILGAVDRPVRVITFLSREAEGRDILEDLLKEYERHNRLVRIEHVDPDRDLGAANDLQARFGVTHTNVLVLVSRDQHVVIRLADMLVKEGDDTRRLGDAPRLIGFRGESLISSALLRLLRDQRDIVYFLTGHGERDPDRFDEDPAAFSDARERLEREGIEVRILDLAQRSDIPEDAAALVIAGPAARIPQPELDLLQRYLRRGGRMMVMLNLLEDAGLEPLLLEWGIQLVPDVVVDPAATLTGMDVHVTSFQTHPITRGMQQVRTVFIRPRSVLPAAGRDENAGADRPRFTALAASSHQSWAELDLTEDPIRYTPGVDQRGPIPLAAAIEQPGGPGTRLVVVGDADFAANWLRSGGGILFFRNAVNWLIEREEAVALPPAPVDELRILMDRQQLNRLLLLVTVVLPGGVALLGILVAWRRRV